jgi:hypothetical protein
VTSIIHYSWPLLQSQPKLEQISSLPDGKRELPIALNAHSSLAFSSDHMEFEGVLCNTNNLVMVLFEGLTWMFGLTNLISSRRTPYHDIRPDKVK